MKNLVIFGSGGFSREVHQIINDINNYSMEFPKWNLMGFLDGNEENHGKIIHNDFLILGGIDWLIDHPDVHVAIAVGNPAVKRKIVSEIKNKIDSIKFATLIDPKAIVGDWNSIGEGTIVCAGTIITTDIKIGDHVIINLSCTIGHDTVIKNFCTIAPSVNVSGNVTVGEGCDLGTGAAIIQGKFIGEWSIIGAGAVVVKDVPTNTTSVGNPTKVIKERLEGWHTPKETVDEENYQTSK